jgi:hypothetical protein
MRIMGFGWLAMGMGEMERVRSYGIGSSRTANYADMTAVHRLIYSFSRRSRSGCIATPHDDFL